MSLAERLLIGRLRKRDEQAFNEVVRLHGDKVFNLVLRMVGTRAEAEDIAQEVFVTVFKSIDSFRGESKFTTWLLRIAANHSKNRIKSRARRETDKKGLDGAPEASLADHGKGSVHGHIDAPDQLLEAAEMEDILQAAIANLEEEHRLLVILRDVEELSYDEICEVTGLPEGTVKSRLHRARLALKAEIEEKVK